MAWVVFYELSRMDGVEGELVEHKIKLLMV